LTVLYFTIENISFILQTTEQNLKNHDDSMTLKTSLPSLEFVTYFPQRNSYSCSFRKKYSIPLWHSSQLKNLNHIWFISSL